MTILAIDPGNVQSAWMVYDADAGRPETFAKANNGTVLNVIRERAADVLVLEMVASYGMPVGREVFETCVWIGRFVQAWHGPHSLVYRRDVKLHLCNSARAKDSNIRQALIDRFGPPGTKKAPGITYGISKDVWSALALAVTYADRACEAVAEAIRSRIV